jgi:hypothetical protein
MSRFGITPTGMRVTSFLDPTSNTETAFEPALETKHRLPSAVNVSQSGASPTLVVPSRLRASNKMSCYSNRKCSRKLKQMSEQAKDNNAS